MWTDQLKNALRLTLRRLFRQRLNTSLHIAGLTIGMSVCLMIGLFLRHELSFDAYHSKADRIYRINTIWTDNGNKSPHFSTPVPLGDALREEVPGLEFVAQWHPIGEEIVEINPQRRFAQKTSCWPSRTCSMCLTSNPCKATLLLPCVSPIKPC